MTAYINPTTRRGGTTQVVVPERGTTVEVQEAPFDDTQYVRQNGEWVQASADGIIPDTLAPSPPSNLAASGSIVAETGAVDYELSWDAPTTNTDTTPLTDLAYYVVRWRYSGGSAWTSFVSNDEVCLLVGITLGLDVEWEVLARDYSGNDSTWASDTIIGVNDTTPPDQPKPPGATTRLGVIRVTWDGLLVGDTAPPADFDHLEIFVSATTGGPWTYVDRLSGAGSVFITDVPIGDTRYLSSLAFDTSGNISARSAESSVVAIGVTGDDIEANSVVTNNLEAGAIDGMVITGATFQTDAAADTGVKIDTDGLRAYDGTGAVSVEVNSATGELTAVGTFRTGPVDEDRIEITTDPDNIHYIKFIESTMTAGYLPAYIYGTPAATGTLSSDVTTGIGIISGTKDDGNGEYTSVSVRPGDLYLIAADPGQILRNASTIQMRNTDGKIIVSPGNIPSTNTPGELVISNGGLVSDVMRSVAYQDNADAYIAASTSSAVQTGMLIPTFFDAPPSGVVIAHGTLFVRNSSGRYECNWVLKETDTSGTLIQNPRATIDDGNAWTFKNPVMQFSGLTPGQTYCLYFNHFAPSGGTSQTQNANIVVVPQP